MDKLDVTVLGTVKDGHLELPPLRGAFGILDRPYTPLPPENIGTGSVSTSTSLQRVEQEAGLTGGAVGKLASLGSMGQVQRLGIEAASIGRFVR